ncbi:uncharacterized protein LOC123499484 [Portunus trituberculatus]|uniref:uncharacterized protein LOC123499484 n=1 Tax=Portunus trituberculatus TaxID=210409 RepID=UPI001E1CD974|nr:uncharacterized protein LOC123499484 [Portunus trituberculatus]
MLSAAFTPLEKLYGNYIPNSSFEYLRIKSTFVEVMPRDEKQTFAQPHYAHTYDGETKVKGNTSKEQEFTKVPPYRKKSLNAEHTGWGTFTSPSTQQETDALLLARRSVTVIEHLEATTTTLLAPIICLQMLLECILNVTYMMCILPEDAKEISLNLMYICASMLKIYLLLTAPEDYRRMCAKIRKNLRLWSLHVTSPFLQDKIRDTRGELAESSMAVADMFGFFHLGRHCILPAGSLMATYFVILLQLRLSEGNSAQYNAFGSIFDNFIINSTTQ